MANRHDDNQLINESDVIVIAFHHAAFDRGSREIFFDDLCLAYNTDRPLSLEEDRCQYIDYSVHERTMDIFPSRDFWRSQLEDYDLERCLVSPVDRYRVADAERSSMASIVEFTFTDDLSCSFLHYASSHHITPFQLGLALFYAFLFKLSNGQNDLCITCINANRYRAELRDLIGMFVATLPYRVDIDPHDSFDQLVQQVRERTLSILEHSHYPLQHILGSQRSPAFLETVFDFVTLGTDNEQLTLDGVKFKPVPSQQSDNVAKFDLMLAIMHNPAAANNKMSCSFICSHDIFDQATVQILADRFSVFVHRLFDSASVSVTTQSLCNLSIILSDELKLLYELNNSDDNRKESINGTIGQIFCEQVVMLPQKLSVELDDQSVTYSELLFYVQRLSLLLLNKHNVKPGEIICQMVERNLSMVGPVQTHFYDTQSPL
jgi:non-ribosomal peptide synthetase component F